MKMVYLANIRMPTDMAHGVQIMRMCEAFALAGLDVELIVPRRFNQIKTDPFAYYNVKKNFKIKKLFCVDLLIFQLGRFGFLAQTFSFLLAARIYLWFKRPEILYVRSEFAGTLFRNYILEIHTLPEEARVIHKNTWRRAKKMVALTSFIKTDLVKSGLSEQSIIVAPDGVNLSQFDIGIERSAARKKLNLPLDKKIVLYSGSFCFNDWFNWKGVDLAVKAAESFNQDFLFVLVGGEDREVEAMEQKYPIKNLKLVSHQEQKTIPYYLKAADILLLPNKKGSSNSEKHTSPLKLFEYMASGVPIIASDLPSLREILNDGNCLFFTPNDADDLAKKIKFLFSQSNLAKKISRQARLEVNQYTWEKRVGAIINFIMSDKK